MSNSLFSRSQNSDNEDIWDDSLLIKAYEESVKLQKEDVAKKIAMKTNKKESKKSEPDDGDDGGSSSEKFKIGDFCRSTYEDGVDYEAEILSINENGNALIRYIGYGNEQRINVEDLISSWGLVAREEQKLLAEADHPLSNAEESLGHKEELHNFIINKSSTVHAKLPIPPMPPMPPGMFDSSRDTEYMSAMLCSWYMSGYYTGLYHGRKEIKEELASATVASTTKQYKEENDESTSFDNVRHERKKQRKLNTSKHEK